MINIANHWDVFSRPFGYNIDIRADILEKAKENVRSREPYRGNAGRTRTSSRTNRREPRQPIPVIPIIKPQEIQRRGIGRIGRGYYYQVRRERRFW